MNIEMLRFLTRVETGPGCWLWKGSMVQKTGYGMFKGRPAHRLSYELFVGQIPVTFDIDHLCRTPLCVRPDHLQAVTTRENLRRAPSCVSTINSLKTHCKHGHLFDALNTYWRLDKKTGLRNRMCRACRREGERRRRGTPGEAVRGTYF